MMGKDRFWANPVHGKFHALVYKGFFIVFVLLFFHAAGALSKEIEMSWTPNQDVVAGYRIYMRLPDGQYDYTRSAASLPSTDCTAEKCSVSVALDELQDCYFVVRAFSEANLESDNSNEVFFDAAQYRQALAGLPEKEEADITTTDTTTSNTGALSQTVASPVEDAATEASTQETQLHPTIEVFTPQYAHREWLQILWDDYVVANGEARLAMGDIDGDGRDEIVVGLGPDHDPAIPGGLFQVLDDDYSHLAWGQIQWGGYNIENGEGFPACGDVDGDGVDEILVGLGEGGQGKVEVFQYRSGKVQHTGWFQVDWPEYNQYFGKTKPACGDIDQDGKDEIVIGLGSDLSDPAMPAGLFQIKDDDFSELAWGELEWPDYNRFNGETYPSCANLEGRGSNNIIVGLGTGGEGRLEVFSFLNGAASHKDWITIDWPEYNQAAGATRPVCGDIDGDGMDEILVGLAPYANDATIPGGRLPILDNDYTHLAWTEISWPEYNSENGESFPASGDTDGDDTDEIVIGLGIRSAFAADQAPDASPGSTSDGNRVCFISTLPMDGED